MAGEGPDTASGQETVRASQDELLSHAVSILRFRYERGEGYPGLSPTAARELGQTLTEIADAGHPVDHGDRAQAIALAHRLVDNDHPEHSPLWPEVSGQQ